MIISRNFTDVSIARTAGYIPRTVYNIRSNLECFGHAKAPSNGVRQRSVTQPMLAALCERLVEKPDLYRDEMVIFLSDEFDTLVTASSISRTLPSAGWSKKVARRVPQERNTDLRDFYLHELSAFRPYHLVFVDESGCDKRARFRQTGRSLLGVTPEQVARFHRENILFVVFEGQSTVLQHNLCPVGTAFSDLLGHLAQIDEEVENVSRDRVTFISVL
ncbi:hypothetical protein CKAH01_17013 [Colletotrichum kahawae]|uniref:Transposase n=1 Tax=Colletotrichum kahawae TaxID=34407 RepID=A0AAD9YFD5_COLKA|nr:hypothetical protein CKAH01_17013 [Colletotrichum kahawae]